MPLSLDWKVLEVVGDARNARATTRANGTRSLAIVRHACVVTALCLRAGAAGAQEAAPEEVPAATAPPPSSEAAAEPSTESLDELVSSPESAEPAGAKPEAEPEEDGELLDLSLAEVLEVEVTVASKQEESLLVAPGMVTVYSSEQIKRYGYYTLADLADITAGYSSYTLFGERVFETRGQKAGSFNNNKHLLLVDGIPINHAKSDKAPIDYEFPLYFADQVEFLRGPSSTLYGTSAFFGVVAIKPKTLTEPGSAFEAKASLGLPVVDPDEQSWLVERRVMANALQRTERHMVSINGGYFARRPSLQVSGDTGSDRPEVYAPPSQTLNYDGQDSVFLRVADTVHSGPVRGTTFAVMYMDRTTGHGEYFRPDLYAHESAMLEWTTFIPYVKFERKVSDEVIVQSFVKYNLSRERGRLIRFGPEGFAEDPATGTIPTDSAYAQYVHDFEGLFQLDYRPWEIIDVIAGADIDTRKQSSGGTEGYAFVNSPAEGAPPPDDVELGSAQLTTLSGFGQARASLPVLAGLDLTLGLRGDVGFGRDHEYDQLSPRAAAVLRLTDRTAFKLLYSSALRAPSVKELNLNDEARASLERRGEDTSGIVELEAEMIQALEAVIAFESRRISGTTAVFANRTENPLDGVPYRGENIFVNTNREVDAIGIEGELKVLPIADLPIIVNGAMARATDELDQPVDDVPVLKANFGVGYQLHAPIELGAHVWAKWVSSYTVADPARNGGDGHFTVDVNIIGKITSDLSAELLVQNIADEIYYYPFGGLARAPGPRRSALLTAALSVW